MTNRALAFGLIMYVVSHAAIYVLLVAWLKFPTLAALVFVGISIALTLPGIVLGVVRRRRRDATGLSAAGCSDPSSTKAIASVVAAFALMLVALAAAIALLRSGAVLGAIVVSAVAAALAFIGNRRLRHVAGNPNNAE